jgi:hypothetical protein
MTPADLLAELARLAVVVEASDDGRPMLDGVFAEELMTAARAHRWLFTWGLRGARSGHSWFVCDACSELQLLSRERGCGLKPGCKGRMHRAPAPAFIPSDVIGSELEASMENQHSRRGSPEEFTENGLMR